MKEIWVKAENGHLVGQTSADQEAILEMEGERVKATLTNPKGRSISQNGLYWVMCGHLADNLDTGEGEPPVTKEMVSHVLKIESGHADVVRFMDGTYRHQPRSIAFNKMRHEDFCKFLDRAFSVAYIKFGPALAAAARTELEKMMAG